MKWGEGSEFEFLRDILVLINHLFYRVVRCLHCVHIIFRVHIVVFALLTFSCSGGCREFAPRCVRVISYSSSQLQIPFLCVSKSFMIFYWLPFLVQRKFLTLDTLIN